MKPCQLTPLLAMTKGFREFVKLGAITSPTHTHHIWGGTQRRNRKANLVRVGPSAHRFIHERPNAGRVCCLYAKLVQGQLDIDSLDSCANQSTMAWVERQSFDDPLIELWRLEVLAWEEHRERRASVESGKRRRR